METLLFAFVTIRFKHIFSKKTNANATVPISSPIPLHLPHYMNQERVTIGNMSKQDGTRLLHETATIRGSSSSSIILLNQPAPNPAHRSSTSLYLSYPRIVCLFMDLIFDRVSLYGRFGCRSLNWLQFFRRSSGEDISCGYTVSCDTARTL